MSITPFNTNETQLSRFSTFETETLEDSLKLLNATQDTISVESIMDGEVKEPKEFVLGDIIIEPTEIVDDNGEVHTEPRTVFIREDGKAISTISRTIYRTTVGFVDMVTKHPDWKGKVKVVLNEGKSRNKRKFYNVRFLPAD